MTASTKPRCRILWVPLALLALWGCAGAYSSPLSVDGHVAPADEEGWDYGVLGSDVLIGGWDSSAAAQSDSGMGDGADNNNGPAPCQPSCAGKLCGASDGCGGTCKSGSGCCAPSCASKLCGASDGCGGTCKSGSGCCTPSCTGKSCGASDGCGGTCNIGSGCSTTCGTWQAANPDDPWDDADPNYDGERGCNGSLIKDFGRVTLEATCRTKCQNNGASCCARDHRADHKSCKAYDGKVVVVGGCTGCTAASCK